MQPVQGTSDQFLDPTLPRRGPGQDREDIPIDIGGVESPTTSPYGDIDRWDVLWLGHCGNRFPRPSDDNAPLGRVPLYNDETAPEHEHLDLGFSNLDLVRQYPEHTRVVARARQTTCTFAYGISQGGAPRIMWELGVKKPDTPFDVMLQYVCDGREGRKLGTCFSVQPQLFQHHRPVGPSHAFSDINRGMKGLNKRAFTKNVRWSVRLNFPALVAGRTDFVDQLEDGKGRAA